MMGSFGMGHSILVLVWIAIVLIPCWRIVQKAGFNGAFALLGLIPVVNLVLLWVFAFMKWPNERSGG
jgi:membrane-bound metal-dependent hydrolase YbcI (DUF457 family)